MTVPCGQCAECIAQKRAEWHLRSQVEYDYCQRNGGYVFFDTLTYSNDYIPHFKNHVCFERKHLQDFMKRLRRRIAKNEGILERAFRYFYVSEYGHQYKRPHYHVLFFVSSVIDVRKFKRYIRESWIYGLTDLTSVTRPENGIVRSNLCCNYVAKYVTKPDSYINDLYESMKDEVSLDDFRKHFHPFHQQSNKFGESLLWNSKQLPYFKEMFCVLDRKKYTLPLYYIRRLYYKLETNPDGSQSWRENELGCQLIPQYKYMLYEDYSKNLRSYVDTFPQLLSIPGVFTKVKEFFIKDNNVFGQDYSLSDMSRESICKFLSRYDSEFLSKFAFWKRFLQGYIVKDDSFNPLINFAADEKELVRFNCYESKDRTLLSVYLDSRTEPEYLLFDSILNQFRLAEGELDSNLMRLTEKTKRMFTYFQYGN